MGLQIQNLLFTRVRIFNLVRNVCKPSFEGIQHIRAYDCCNCSSPQHIYATTQNLHHYGRYFVIQVFFVMMHKGLLLFSAALGSHPLHALYQPSPAAAENNARIGVVGTNNPEAGTIRARETEMEMHNRVPHVNFPSKHCVPPARRPLRRYFPPALVW